MGDVKKTHCIYTYRTSWPTCDNVVMSLWDAIYPDTYIPTQIGIVELRIANVGDHKGVGYIWNLQIHESYRGIGLGKILLREIINYAKMNGCKSVTLDWSIDEAPRWVFDWYIRQGFDEKEFGRDCAFMEKKLDEQPNTETA